MSWQWQVPTTPMPDVNVRQPLRASCFPFNTGGVSYSTVPWEMLQEYGKAVRQTAGEPGPGHFFYYWVVSSGDHKLVELVSHAQRGFEAFPADPRLETFDRDDRKFVAAAIVSGRTETQIVNAVDSDYRLHQAALDDAGVVVQELCPEELSRS